MPESIHAAWRPASATDAPAAVRVTGFLRRMRIYLRETFPTTARLLMAVLLYVSFGRMLARLHGWPVAATVPDVLMGSWSAFATMLVLRLMDELKDQDVDRRLFATRPLPSGRVRASDIRISLFIVAGVYVATHLSRGPACGTALAVLGYAALMFRWFFVPGLMRPRLLLTLATHNPVIPVLLLHLAVLAGGARGKGPSQLEAGALLPLVVMYWAPVFAWEIARKVRSPQEENAYVTYSRLLGRAGAVMVAAAAQTVALAVGLRVTYAAGLHPAWIVCAGAGWALAQAAHVRFLARPDARSSRLRPFAELFLVSVLLAGLFA